MSRPAIAEAVSKVVMTLFQPLKLKKKTKNQQKNSKQKEKFTKKKKQIKTWQPTTYANGKCKYVGIF